MSPSRSQVWLIAALAAGLLSAFLLPAVGVGSDVVLPIVGVVFAICGVSGLVSAALLASGQLQPSRRWGASPLGVVPKAITPLCMAWFIFSPASTEHVPWFVGLLVVVPMVLGFRIDQRAWERHHAT